MDENKKIVIDLSQTDTKAFDNPIQTSAKENFKKLMVSFLNTIENTENTDENCKIDRVHNTILVNGKRGMGKTSFILSVQKDKELEAQFRKICSFCIIDPTLIETKEHVLLNIITLIKEKVDNYLRKHECNNNQTSDYQNWKESLKTLAGGLSMLDGVGKNHLQEDMWDSPELILEKGLSNAKQGHSLEKNFHKFIDISLKILDKKAFFLILDDIDTSLDKGRDILEVLRKYLTSRKLIIAMLGDIDLYSILVRQLQWEKMDPNKILKEYEGKNRYLNQIEHLEEQYLVKVLKPENRIDLKNLFDLKENLAINSKEESFSVFVNDMIGNVYLTKKSRYNKYYEQTLLAQSTRSILQILQSWGKNRANNCYDFIVSIKHTFYTTLKKKLEPYNLLEIPQKEQFLNLLSMYILKEGISRDNHLKLTPEFSKDEDNIAMLYLNAMANFLLKPSDYLAYCIKVGYALERYRILDISDDKNYFSKFIDHIALDNNESTSKISKKLLTTFKIDSTTRTNNPIFFGNLSLSSSRQDSDLNAIHDGSNLSVFMSRVMNLKSGSHYVLSFFNLIGLLSDITGNKEYQINEILKNNNLIRDFYIFEGSDSKISDSEQENDKKNFDISNELIKEMVEWALKSEYIGQKLSLFTLSKIWIRIVYTFNDIEERNKKKNAYELLDLYIAGFLNAFYVQIEIARGNVNVDIKNPSINCQYFYDKLKKDKRYSLIKGKKEYELKQRGNRYKKKAYTLFDYLYECPIFKDFKTYFGSLSNINYSKKILNSAKKTENSSSNLSSSTNKSLAESYSNFFDLSDTEKKEAIENALDKIILDGIKENKEAIEHKYITDKLIDAIHRQLYRVQKIRITKEDILAFVKRIFNL